MQGLAARNRSWCLADSWCSRSAGCILVADLLVQHVSLLVFCKPSVAKRSLQSQADKYGLHDCHGGLLLVRCRRKSSERGSSSRMFATSSPWTLDSSSKGFFGVACIGDVLHASGFRGRHGILHQLRSSQSCSSPSASRGSKSRLASRMTRAFHAQSFTKA